MNEVVIAGGGPAGAATAIHLAEAGRQVVLLERTTFPRRKPCGEGLFPPGVEELRRLGVFGQIDGAPLRAVRFRAGHAAATAEFSGGTALGVERAVLDTVLLQRARSAGVEVREGVAVRSLILDSRGRPRSLASDEGVIEARVIVAADGLRSRLRAQAGLDAKSRAQRFGVTAHLSGVPHAPDVIEVLVRSNFELYITPLSRGRINVACLGDRAFVQELAADGWSGFRGFIASNLGLTEGAIELCDGPSAAGPFPASSRRAYRGRLVLVGDAAGFFDGISGEGISLALRNARECAAAIDRALTAHRTAPFAGYDRSVRDLARNSTLLARLSLFLARHPRLAVAAVENLARHPATFERLVAISSGGQGMRSLRPADLGSLLDPRSLFKPRTAETASSSRSVPGTPGGA